MTALLLGLILFLGIHSVRMFANDWRQHAIQRLGEAGWKGMYSIVSAVGIALIVWGYGQARMEPVVLWIPPTGLRHAASVLTLLAFVLLAAAYIPRNAWKASLKHPMVLGTKVWALAHLLSNGTLSDVLLFGSFLIWSILLFRASRRRDGVSSSTTPTRLAATLATVGVGAGAWAAFAFGAHAWLIGVSPLGR